MKHRILFVDDEPKILEGLGRMLRGQRHEWDMDFAAGGEQALEKLERAPFDAVVSDMRMPGLDGGQLLARVRDHYPHMVRIVLSGQYDKAAFLRLATVAHRHLAKPCDAVILRESVNRACQFRELLTNDELRALVTRLESVPSRPSTRSAAMHELEKAPPSFGKVAEIIAQDAGITAKILQLANSALHGASDPIANLERAVNLLGFEVLKPLVLALETYSEIDNPSICFPSLDALWNHSILSSTLARSIAMSAGCSAAIGDCAFVAGVLQDIGILILAHYLPDCSKAVGELARRELIPSTEAERATLGTTHAEIGAYLLGLWGFDPSIVEAVAWHHKPGGSSATNFTPRTAVHVANALIRVYSPCSASAAGTELDSAYIASIGLENCLDSWHELAQRLVSEENKRISTLS